jgi:hypothetical protein
MKRPTMLLAIAVIALAACREKPAADQQTKVGMQSMPMEADSIMPMMRAHLDSLDREPGQMSPEMIARHQEMASRMLDAMGSDMRMMDMRPDSAWTTLADSVRRDLAELPSLSGRALDTRIRVHVGRMRRLLDMHTTMMQRMTRP